MLSRTILTSLGCLLVFVVSPRFAHGQVTTQAVWQGECDEMCVATVDNEGNTVGGACMQYGEGQGMGDGCHGSLANGCSLQVYCLPPVGVGELKGLDGTSATFCLNVLPEVAVAADASDPERTHQYVAST